VIEIPVSTAELVDKLSILELKAAHLSGLALEHVHTELALLRERLRPQQAAIPAQLAGDLAALNGQLWAVEDQLREHERRQCFDHTFITLARSVYRLNDQRAALKRQINLASGSGLIEEKAYSQPGP
jgi:hypothetical protein